MFTSKTGKTIAVSASAAAIMAAMASPAYADSNPGTNAGTPITVTISNPAAATVTIGASTLTISATANDSEATAAPEFTGFAPDGQQQGGITVDVQDNSINGYSLDATSTDLTSGSNTQPAYDLNEVNTSAVNGDPITQQFTTSHLGEPGLLNDPMYPVILSNTGPTSVAPNWTDWQPQSYNVNSSGPAGTDETEIAFFVQPDTLLGTATGYTATVSFVLVPGA